MSDPPTTSHYVRAEQLAAEADDLRAKGRYDEAAVVAKLGRNHALLAIADAFHAASWEDC